MRGSAEAVVLAIGTAVSCTGGAFASAEPACGSGGVTASECPVWAACPDVTCRVASSTETAVPLALLPLTPGNSGVLNTPVGFLLGEGVLGSATRGLVGLRDRRASFEA